jgi:hypothetical protein
MDCIQAQALISEAVDGNPVDAAALEAAKAHCRECEQCGRYVRALSAVRRAAAPAPPADLPDRIMAAVRAEAAAAEREARAAEAALTTETESSGTASDESPQDAAVPAILTTRLSVGGKLDRRQLIAWGSAAAVLLVVVGVSAALGIMRLMAGTSSTTASIEAAQAPAVESAAKSGSSYGAADSAAPAAGGSAATDAEVSPGLYVAYKESIYVLASADVPPADQLTTVGQTQVTFNAAQPPSTRDVKQGADKTLIYIDDDSHQPQPFQLVKRVYLNVDYLLRSADLAGYGTWPTLPSAIPKPVPENNLEGTPAFELDGQDASGTPVYHRLGTDRRNGIAIPPGTAASDPAAGNPNWTWWVPAGN